MSETLKVDISLGILNLCQKRGYKVYHMIARFLSLKLLKSVCKILQCYHPNETLLAIRILQKEILEFFVEFIFIWPTVALLGVKDYWELDLSPLWSWVKIGLKTEVIVMYILIITLILVFQDYGSFSNLPSLIIEGHGLLTAANQVNSINVTGQQRIL